MDKKALHYYGNNVLNPCRNRWVSTNNALPPLGEEVVVFSNSVFIALLKDDDEHGLGFNDGKLHYQLKDVSHWLRLPNLPVNESRYANFACTILPFLIKEGFVRSDKNDVIYSKDLSSIRILVSPRCIYCMDLINHAGGIKASDYDSDEFFVLYNQILEKINGENKTQY